MSCALPDRADWYPTVEGFPRPSWNEVRAWIESHVPRDELDEMWTEAARQWLRRVAVRLGNRYHMSESDNFLLVSVYDSTRAADILRYLESTVKHILRILHGIVSQRGFGKHVILVFDSRDEYYEYVSHFYKEPGEYGGSAGMFIRAGGYLHIVQLAPETSPGLSTLVHELIHNYLVSLPLPSWLNEALTMMLEHDLTGRRRLRLSAELAEEHAAFWTVETIQEFWTGKSFHRADNGQQLSYSLAEILLHKIIYDVSPSKEDLCSFVINANRNDAGDAAARRWLGVGIRDLVAGFLGPGDWQPRPAEWERKSASE